MPAPDVDDSEFPLVKITFRPGLMLEDIDTHHQRFERLFKERGAFLSIADLDTVEQKDLTPLHRKKIAESANALSQQGAFIAEYVIASSAIMRGVFTAYNWLRRTKHPVKAFATWDDAVSEARAVLGRRVAKSA